MCVFKNSEGTVVEGLLPNKEDFKFPIGDDFGGDVLIGYKSMYFESGRDEIRSSLLYTLWRPGEPVTASGGNLSQWNPVSGIHAWSDISTAKKQITRWSNELLVEIALWGKAIDFEGLMPKNTGCLGRFAHPLGIWVNDEDPYIYRRIVAKLKRKWEPVGVTVGVISDLGL